MKTIEIKINKAIPDYIQGQIVTVQVDSEGTPLTRFWRDRLCDAAVDNCVEIIKLKSSKKTSAESPKEDTK